MEGVHHKRAQFIANYSLRIEIFVVIEFFSTTLTIRFIQKVMQVSSILFATCFTIISILSLTYPFTYLQQFFE
jgi:hypothetical protein